MSDLGSAAQIGAPQLAGPALPGALGSTAVSALRARAAGAGAFRSLGLAMRFDVTVENPGGLSIRLGEWTSCDGLKVDFRFEEVRQGGDYAKSYILPQHVAYSQIVLKRAVEAKKSKAVEQWLTSVARSWEAGDALATTGTTMSIVLQDINQQEAHSWEMADVVPVSWTGPSLNAKNADVATETLVLAHGGFLGAKKTP